MADFAFYEHHYKGYTFHATLHKAVNTWHYALFNLQHKLIYSGNFWNEIYDDEYLYRYGKELIDSADANNW